MKKLLCAALISTLILSVGCRNINKDDNLDNGTNPNPNLTENNNGSTTTNPPGTEAMNYVDGVYRAEMDDAAAEANGGWRDYAEVTVTNGKVSDIKVDSKNTEGKLRSEDTTYTMEPTLRGWLDKFVAKVKEIGDVNRIEGLDENVTGTENYRKLVSAALENAKSGNKEVAVVNTAEMK